MGRPVEMSSLRLVVLVVWSAYACGFVIQDRETSLDNPSILSTQIGCRALPQYSCWSSNQTSTLEQIYLRERGLDADVGSCCQLCSQNNKCSGYNYHAAEDRCQLLSTTTTTTDKLSSCAGGHAASVETQSVKRDTRPNIVFLVVES